MNRRELIHRGAGSIAALALASGPARLMAQNGLAPFAPSALVPPILARRDRLFRVTVCLRPFRAAGPRIEVERLGRKTIVHHYGHGGSGWSLAWGSALEAVPLAMQTGEIDIAVIGAGAIGLTSAITAQRMGAKVTIYAKERFPNVPSAKATGTWSPDSRIGMIESVAADFAVRWERMARSSFAFHQRFLGLAGNPVEWTDRYILSDTPARPAPGMQHEIEQVSGFVELEHRLADITPRAELLRPEEHPFAVPAARRTSTMTFNVADLSHQLESDFLAAGGKFVATEFNSPSDITRIKEKTVINCTGYGARALWRDESVVPVRGQIAWLIPQAGVTYGVYHNQLSILARRDGIVLQPLGQDDFYGYNDASEIPDMAAAHAAVDQAATLFRITALPPR